MFPPGSVQRSEGWFEKVISDDIISRHPEGAPLTVEADGAPFFKDKNCGSCNFGTLRHASLPIELRLDPGLAHLFLVVPAEHLERKRLERVQGQREVPEEDPTKPAEKKPFGGGSMQMTLLPLMEELRVGYETGHPIRNHSVPLEDPRSYFHIHSVLLYFVGDYPGQGKACNMSHMGGRACHWCNHYFKKVFGDTGKTNTCIAQHTKVHY
jgi:hypothetical protein